MADETLSVDDEVLSIEDVAVVLGVHYMTAYRYVKRRALEATQVSGQWQIKRSDLDDFVKRRSDRHSKAEGSQDARRTADYHRELERCLVNSDAKAAFEVIQAAIDAGADMEEVYLDILGPVMAEIGASWARGEIDISVEHRATAVATRLVGQLSPRCVRRGRHRGNVLIGAPAGERHSLALAMLGDLLRLHGWDVSDLGADTPSNSFVHAASSIPELVAVGVSVTSSDSLASAAELVTTLRRAIGDDVPVLVGGSAILDVNQARSLGADHFAEGARGFIAFLDSLGDKSPKQPAKKKKKSDPDAN
ncbi:MAG: helix-turn-helix domain-containing protein [Acidimicrobiia bacterium]|nr:helix-turn-helix domain-containing protein [Acidimicrobiia bacterium]NDD97170.1 helix-turn-helix domain-containing protein [Actinomycetota bacterium]NDE80072.1 helix-turn-helix domain-containing protein [Actinomycetota bacterium]NDF31606.1 helix-turn-helix domain-containing protein [Acidimicrobiia bacterium]